MKASAIVTFVLLLCSSQISEAANRKIAFNIGDGFSLNSNPSGPWTYGVIRTTNNLFFLL